VDVRPKRRELTIGFQTKVDMA